MGLSNQEEVVVLGARAYMPTAQKLVCEHQSLKGKTKVWIPKPDMVDEMDVLVREVKNKGRDHPSIGVLFAEILNKLPSQVSVVVLACTELPLIRIPAGKLRAGLQLLDAP